MTALATLEIKDFVPAKDFALSKPCLPPAV